MGPEQRHPRGVSRILNGMSVRESSFVDTSMYHSGPATGRGPTQADVSERYAEQCRGPDDIGGSTEQGLRVALHSFHVWIGHGMVWCAERSKPCLANAWPISFVRSKGGRSQRIRATWCREQAFEWLELGDESELQKN